MTRQIEEMRNKLRKAGAKELTPEDGVILRMNFNEEYLLDEERFIAVCLDQRVYVWDLFPDEKRQ